MRQSDGAYKAGLVFVDNLETKHDRFYYELTDVFTTQDGEWYKSLKLFSIPQWAVESYLGNSLDAGGATHAFALVLDLDGLPIEAAVASYWHGPQGPINVPTKRSGWANHPLVGSYNPDRLESGQWRFGPQYADFHISGVGLPYQWHVSTLGVWRKRLRPLNPDGGDPGGDKPDKPTPDGKRIEIALTAPTVIEVKSNRQPFQVIVKE